jgi:hypothetical protein
MRCSKVTHGFKKRFFAKSLCTTCSRTSYKIDSLTNLNKYLHSNTSETDVNINISVNNGSEKLLKKNKTVTVSKLIIAAYASVVYVYNCCITGLSSRLEYNFSRVGIHPAVLDNIL